jgi:hypothetical protein
LSIIYYVSTDDPLPPLPPRYSENDTDTGLAICLQIPDTPISPVVYEVNLTDSTGSMTGLSGIYNTSQCLKITSDFYPAVCGPFQLSVAAINSVGRVFGEERTLLQGNQPMPCDCFREKGSYVAVGRPCLASSSTRDVGTAWSAGVTGGMHAQPSYVAMCTQNVH